MVLHINHTIQQHNTTQHNTIQYNTMPCFLSDLLELLIQYEFLFWQVMKITCSSYAQHLGLMSTRLETILLHLVTRPWDTHQISTLRQLQFRI